MWMLALSYLQRQARVDEATRKLLFKLNIHTAYYPYYMLAARRFAWAADARRRPKRMCRVIVREWVARGLRRAVLRLLALQNGVDLK